MTQGYAAKLRAATNVIRYGYSQDVRDLENAERNLASSLEFFKALAQRTSSTYRFANSMQTSQRKIPVSGGHLGMGTNYHWTHLVPLYTKELEDFHTSVTQAKKGTLAENRIASSVLRSAEFKLLST